MIATAVGPPLLAALWWTVLWANGHRMHPTLLAALLIGDLVCWVAWPFLWYFELVRMICGPDPFKPQPRKKRRKVRVRLERYCSEATYFS
jgi:hypothetical protein